MNRNHRLRAFSLAIFIISVVLLAGCGGGTTSMPSASRKSGRLQVTVNWPPYQPSNTAASSGATKQAHRSSHGSGRLLAYNATSILITVHDPTASNGLQTFTVTRENPVHTFALPVGSFPVDVQEYADGSSVALAVGSDTLVIKANVDTPLTISPFTQIVKLKIAAPANTVLVGDQLAITATPVNANGDMVPIPAKIIQYITDKPAVTIPDPLVGSVQGVSFGDVNIQATFSETALGSVPGNEGVFAFQSDPLPIHVGVKLSITPTTGTVAEQATAQYPNTIQFAANAPGDGGAGITWKVVENQGGTITQGGLYTAPFGGVNTPDGSGTFHVRAFSSTDNTSYAEATVTVIAGILIVNAN